MSQQPLYLQGYGVFLAKLWGLYTSTVQLQQQALALLSSSPQVPQQHGCFANFSTGTEHTHTLLFLLANS